MVDERKDMGFNEFLIRNFQISSISWTFLSKFIVLSKFNYLFSWSLHSMALSIKFLTHQIKYYSVKTITNSKSSITYYKSLLKNTLL